MTILDISTIVCVFSVTVPLRLANATYGPVSLCCVFTNIFQIKLKLTVEI